MRARLTPHRPRSGDLLPFLLLSLLTHAAVLAWLNHEPLRLPEEAEPPPIVVQLAPEIAEAPEESAEPAPEAPAPPPAVAKQIVAPSDRENEQAPEGRAYLSDRDNRVEQETIRRGNPEAGTPGAKPVEEGSPEAPPAAPPPPEEPAPQARPEPEPAPAPARPEPAPPRPAAEARPAARPLPGLDKLFAPPAEVLARAGPPGSAPSADRAADSEAVDPRRDLMAAPPPVPGVLSGLRGSFDDLPDVAPGQLTMLNTKADRFAPFVRRVGTRVFQNMLIYQRRDLGAPDILAAAEIVTVRAILDEGGKLKSLEIVDRSGSPAMDRTLVDAVRQAAFDPNPPAGAANVDGEFEFIFQAQILASVQPGLREQRIRAVESRLRIGLM